MTAATGRGRSNGAGVGLAVVSAASFGLSGTLARGLMDAGWSAGAAVTARLSIATLVLLVPAAALMRGRWHLLRRNATMVTAYGLVAVAGCQLAAFNAVAHLQVGVALLIEYTAPAAVACWQWLRHGDRPGPLTLAGAALAACGLVLVLDLGARVRPDVAGVAWALAAMVGAATYFVMSASEADALPAPVLAAGGLGVGAVGLLAAGAVGLVPLSFSTGPVAYTDLVVPWWLPLVALGVVTAALAYVTGIAASRRLGARLASFVALVEVLFALTFAWALLDQLPRQVQVAGGAAIVLGVVLVRLGEPAVVDSSWSPASTTPQVDLLVHTYVAAWNETDPEGRRALLEQCWAEDGRYEDPSAQAYGRASLDDHIGRVQRRRPGSRLEVLGDVDHHHSSLRFEWRLIRADGTPGSVCTDVAEIGADGLLTRVTGFFGPLGTAPATD